MLDWFAVREELALEKEVRAHDRVAGFEESFYPGDRFAIRVEES